MTRPQHAAAAHPPIAADAETLSDEDRAPRYRAIYQDLANAIRAGRYPVMTLLPTEHALCAQYGASRHTVREAVRLLTEAGLVSRRAGVGTRVEAIKPSTRYTQRISKISDLFLYIQNATLRLLETEMIKASASQAEMLGCEPGHAWLRVRSVKLLGPRSAPVAYAEAFVHPDYAAIRDDIGKVRLPLSELIQARYSKRIVEVGQEFSATPIGKTMAAHLKVTPKTAGLVITRRYYGDHRVPMLVTVTTFPHTKMKYSMSLKVDWPD